jgi:ketosteroid isomerase-like protein
LSTQTEQNKALMAKVAAAFKEGDIRLLKESIADDVSWKSTSPASLFRFGGEHFNRNGVTDLLALLFVSYLFRRFDPKEIIAENDVVWGLFEVEAVHLPTRATIRTDIAVRWRIRDGKVIEHQGIFDTASVLIQQGQLISPNQADERKAVF